MGASVSEGKKEGGGRGRMKGKVKYVCTLCAYFPRQRSIRFGIRVTRLQRQRTISVSNSSTRWKMSQERFFFFFHFFYIIAYYPNQSNGGSESDCDIISCIWNGARKWMDGEYRVCDVRWFNRHQIRILNEVPSIWLRGVCTDMRGHCTYTPPQCRCADCCTSNLMIASSMNNNKVSQTEWVHSVRL